MSKLLSQEEIDALLSQDDKSNTESVAQIKSEKEYRLYDFRRPDRVSKDQYRFLRNIHENFAKLLSTFLSNNLRSMIDIKSPIIDQVTYLEFTMSSADFTNLYIFEIDKLEGRAIMEIDPNFTNFVVDRLFGGTGSIINRGNTITIIEQSVMMNIAREILKNFHDAWKNIENLTPKILEFETNPQLVTIAPSSETMIILNFPIVAKSYDFYIYLCFPYFMLEPVLKKLQSQNIMSLLKQKSTSEDKLLVRKNVMQTRVNLSVQLGYTNISVSDFLELQEGNILILKNQINDMIVSKVEKNSKFLGTIGKSGKKYAYKINHIINEEGEIIDEQFSNQ